MIKAKTQSPQSNKNILNEATSLRSSDKKDFSHFPTLRQGKFKIMKYVDAIAALEDNFYKKFQDFNKNETAFHILSMPFNDNVDEVPSNVQMELNKLQ